jgi:hypothetical protein
MTDDVATQTRLIGGAMTGRREGDFYATPPEATQALLRVESFVGDIWEPACGDGAISRVLQVNGYWVISSDLFDRGYGVSPCDFLKTTSSLAPNIVTNPPFKLANQFAETAIASATSKVALLVKLAFLEGAARAELFRRKPPARVWVFSKRVTFKQPGDTGAGGSGMMAFCWVVWDRLGWL